MEQMYLVEIFIDKVTIFASEEDEKSGANKNLIVKIKFGPKIQFIIKEGQLAVKEETQDDIIECDESGRRKWTRTIRVGKSYLFPSYPDTLLMILSKFPLEIEVWNDDENEVEIFVGIGTMHWETQFFHMLKETAEACKIHEPLSIKQVTPLFAECCCKQVGDISFILRLSALGESIITEFQQPMKDPDTFVFRTNKAPSMFQCKRIEGDDPNFCMVGSLYETTTLEDPTVVDNAQQKIEICTELQSCGVGQKDVNYTCKHDGDEKSTPKKKYPIDKIRIGDITGPCGNANCPLAHKVKNYIRNLETYKKEAEGKVTEMKGNTTRKICGTCDCKDDRWHRELCPEMSNKQEEGKKTECSGCGGIVNQGETCEDNKNKMFGTGLTPKTSKTTVAYVFNVTKVPGFKESLYGKEYIAESAVTNFCTPSGQNSIPLQNMSGCCCQKPGCPSTQERKLIDDATSKSENAAASRTPGNQPVVCNVEIKEPKRKFSVYNCFELPDERDCKCNPPKPSPPCKTFDCDCIMETANIASRKTHRPYCPSYKHKNNCPVTMMQEEDLEKKLAEDDENETEPLPYGLPPIKLGPCPVIGRPCSVPDGFARMYKTAALPAQPPSYSDAGKVCCSKEYERIKKAIKDYMRYEKDHDYRCVNKFNVDTERRCCDKEQRLLSLMGRGCCGSHKLAIQEKFKQDKK
ncbi:uncharacterized protein LOC116773322 isoform X1 [Danaus plexippus]|uniref:Uncharacterized protein n=1 Tax=Danaus plexippus plexippus TaxID=278856 RepID=A0A212ETB6_DANPL|nr:uncharacterized protein LOC116773322 isoform X1 [Danaus plexippus]XP_032521649.1 uncharacterized protein LOC116773322 isoform X1 [Danaus plexippus]OWR44745.1 hypothetical protein KGM_202694 [Danaus plexippus plexippus]